MIQINLKKYKILVETQYTKQNCRTEFWKQMQQLFKKDVHSIRGVSEVTEQGKKCL